MGWSEKYKKSIDCSNPKGFSQKAHCAGRKIRKENMKLSELKNIIKDLIQERSINAISKAQEKNREDIARALELYKKAKGGNKSYNEKNLIKVLKKLGQDKKKLEKEMDDKISSLYKNADYKGPIDEASSIWKLFDQKQKLYDEAMDIEMDMKSISKVIGQIYKDMEQEAEPSGGKVADKYGKQLNNLEKVYKKRKMELKKVFAKIDKLERY
jgi:hypothetical protein